MVSTLLTCQLRDSSSRSHLGYSGVLFTMQHSVQHKKNRERARECEKFDPLCLARGIYGCILKGNVWISFGIPEEPAQMKFEMASGCEWEWVLHVAKKQNIYIECIERHADTTCYWSSCHWKSTSNEMKNSCLGELWTFTHRNQVLEKYQNKKMERWKWHTEMNMNNSQFCGPPTKEGFNVPLPQSATLSTRVWMDPLCTNVWTQWWGARFISSNKMLSTGEVLSPQGSSKKSGCASRVYGRMSSVCFAACVTGEYARMVKTHAKRRKRNSREEYQKGFIKLGWKRFWTQNSTLERGWSQAPYSMNIGYWKKKSLSFFVVLKC